MRVDFDSEQKQFLPNCDYRSQWLFRKYDGDSFSPNTSTSRPPLRPSGLRGFPLPLRKETLQPKSTPLASAEVINSIWKPRFLFESRTKCYKGLYI